MGYSNCGAYSFHFSLAWYSLVCLCNLVQIDTLLVLICRTANSGKSPHNYQSVDDVIITGVNL